VISVADPAQPVEVGHYVVPGALANEVTVSGDYAYVASGEAGLQVFQYYGAGVEETPGAGARPANTRPTVVRGVLWLTPATSHKPQAASLLDAAGRKVAELHAGANDVSRLSPGVYFVREEPQASSLMPQAVRKVVVCR
jgi:hypothetical protein